MLLCAVNIAVADIAGDDVARQRDLDRKRRRKGKNGNLVLAAAVAFRNQAAQRRDALDHIMERGLVAQHEVKGQQARACVLAADHFGERFELHGAQSPCSPRHVLCDTFSATRSLRHVLCDMFSKLAERSQARHFRPTLGKNGSQALWPRAGSRDPIVMGAIACNPCCPHSQVHGVAKNHVRDFGSARIRSSRSAEGPNGRDNHGRSADIVRQIPMIV